MGLLNTMKRDMDEFIGKNPNLPEECVVARFHEQFRDRYHRPFDEESMKSWILTGGRVTPQQFPDRETVDARMTAMERLMKASCKAVYVFRNMPVFGSLDPAKRTTLDDDLSYFVKLGDTPDDKRFNARVTGTWNSGKKEDKQSVIREFFEEAGRINLDVWGSRDEIYLADHFEALSRDLRMLAAAESVYRAAVQQGLMAPDAALEKKCALWSDVSYGFELQADTKLRDLMGVFGARFTATWTDRQLSPEELAAENQSFADTLSDADETAYNLLCAAEEGTRTRERYAEFLRLCEENGEPVPGSTADFGKDYEKRYKRFGTEVCNAFYDVLRSREKGRELPWETENCKKGMALAASDPDAVRKAGNYEKIEQYQYYYDQHNNSDNVLRVRTHYLWREVVRDVRLRLGYADGEPFPLVIGGKGENRVMAEEDDYYDVNYLDPKKDISFAADRRTGRVMAIRISAGSEYYGLRDCPQYEIREATEDELNTLRAAQYESLKKKLNELFADEKSVLTDMGKPGEGLAGTLRGIREICAGIDSGKTDLASSSAALNELTAGLGREALRLRGTLTEKSRTGLLTDAEGRTLAFCQKLTGFAVHTCIGVPDGSPESSRNALCADLTPPASLTAEQLTDKLAQVCDTLRATCVGFRRDSDQFTHLLSCAEHSLKTLRDAGENGIALTPDAVREEFRSVYTAANDYFRYRASRDTENGRTHTRVETARTLKTLGESIGCMAFTSAEKLADSLANLRMDQCRETLKKHPESPDARRELVGILKNKTDYVSRIRNNVGFDAAVKYKTAAQLNGYARTPGGLQSFLSDYQSVQNKLKKSAPQPAAGKPGPAVY